MTKKIIFIISFIFLLVLINFPDFFSYYYNYSWEKEYIEENYEKAISKFSKGKNINSDYNLWNSYYRLKDYEKAIEQFLLISNKDNKELAFRSFHNLWNTYYRYWKQNEETKKEKYLTAINYYEKALEISFDEETKANRDFVLNKIKEDEEQKQNEEEQKEELKNNKEKEDKTEQNNEEEESEKNQWEKSSENSEKDEWSKDWTKENWQNEEKENNEIEERISQEDKNELEEYKKMLEDMQKAYSEWFNKVWEKNSNDPFDSFFNDPFFDSFFPNPFFENTIKEEEKDW